MFTKDDYFDRTNNSYGWNEADWQMSFRYDEVIRDIDWLFDLINCTRKGEGYDFLNDCGGIEAEVYTHGYSDGTVDESDWQPMYITKWQIKQRENEPGEFPFYVRDFAAKWNEHHDVLEQLYDMLEKYSERIPWYEYYDDQPRKVQRTWDRYFAIKDRYNAEIQKALDDVCGLANEYLSADYEYFRSDEVVQEWVNDQNWQLMQELIQREARTILAGMTAAYEDYAA